jgi:glycosyltransferase involved in cell wall biosynthesis
MSLLVPLPFNKLVILLPCFNEATTIAALVRGFQMSCPGARIWVYDNNSNDGTFEQAVTAGAQVQRVTQQGKGHVVRQMFAEQEASYYLMADGDGTYDPVDAPKLFKALIDSGADMAVGERQHTTQLAYRAGHLWGNHAINKTVGRLFGVKPRDMLSGYRILRRRFVKSFPVFSNGFEIETEITIHALSLQLPITYVPVQYHERPHGSESKLRTFHDGARILRTIAVFLKDEKPFIFFGLIALLCATVSVLLGSVVVIEFIETRYITRVPTAILVTGLMVTSIVFFAVGIILDSVARGRKELKKLAYLSVEPFS